MIILMFTIIYHLNIGIILYALINYAPLVMLLIITMFMYI